MNKKNQNGSAIVIALMVLALLLAFVALAVSRTTSETSAAFNDMSETKTFTAAQGSLEIMTQNFSKIFEDKLSPAQEDLDHVESLKPPGFDTRYDFVQKIKQTKESETVVMKGGSYKGLNSLRDEWQVDATVTDKNTGTQVELKRQFYNNRIPIFQFGIFYNDDLEFHPGPRFDFGGRVHSNGSLFLMASTGLYFSSRVSASGQILTDVARNGKDYSGWGDNVYIKNTSGTYKKLSSTMGSALKSPATGTPVFYDSQYKFFNLDMPKVYKSSAWVTNKNIFEENLLAEQDVLNLPLKIASKSKLDYVELIKRGKSAPAGSSGGDLFNNGTSVTAVTSTDADTLVTSKERYANKRGIRISLADSKAKLPGCASGIGTTAVSTKCGIRLDGDKSGTGGETEADGSRGYQPKAMGTYQATRLNGNRFYNFGRQVWIKVELVSLSSVDNSVQTDDVTEEFLSLGLTEPAPFSSSLVGYGSKDTRSIIKLQRFAMPGTQILNVPTTTSFMSYPSLGGTNYNVVNSKRRTVSKPSSSYVTTDTYPDNGFADNQAHNVCTPNVTPNVVGSIQNCYVPFPIEMFDSREGVYNFNVNLGTTYGAAPNTKVPWAGVMSMVDIDVENFKRFFDGNFDSSMLTTGTVYTAKYSKALKSSDVPQANGWVIYISDRRGDADFDGEYDMEDIYGNNDEILQPGEDVNNNKKLDIGGLSSFDGQIEAVKYTGAANLVSPAQAASVDHPYYRRGVRLINGEKLPGYYDKDNSLNTRGFTVASENGVYVQGNYNATGISSVGNPSLADAYLPQNTTDHIPASVAADAVTILSNNWLDSRSFTSPFAVSGRVADETHVRFAILSGDALSSYEATPNQGTSDPRLGGGVHNFKRFLENWGSVRLNYCGSLINLYNAHNNNGSFKNSSITYSPPTRNWVFDTSFLDPTRLPPGTPYFQTIQLTGFQRVN